MPRSRAALAATCLLVGVHLAVLAASLPDYRVNVDSGYHVTMARWYGEHGAAFWDHVNFAPVGRPNLQGPALHVAIAIIGRLLGGDGNAYVVANALLAVAQWIAAIGTAIYFARRAGGDWAGLFAAALLAGNGFASYNFAVGLPSGWTFILTPWTIHFFLQRQLIRCVLATALVIYSHFAGYATAPVGIVVAGLLTRRWRDLAVVGAGVLVATAPYTIHVLRHLAWIRGTRGQAGLGLAPLLYLLAVPGVVRMIRSPRRDALWVAWAMEPAAWLLQNYLRYLGQVTLLCSVLGAVWVASVMAKVPSRIRPALALLFVVICTVQWPLNDSALAANWRWLKGTRYPRYIDWTEARELAQVLDSEGLTATLVSSYNPTQCIGIGAFGPLLLEKGHWVEVAPRRDPGDALPAGGKVYVLPLAPDDTVLRRFEERGWIRIRGGSARTSVATLPGRAPDLRDLLPVVRESMVEAAGWLAAHAANNVLLPPGAALQAWRDTLFRQRTAAGHLELATVLYAHASESDRNAASALRGSARGAGSLAYFLGDESAAGFVSDPRHQRMRTHAGALAEAARGLTEAPETRQALLQAFRALFDDYFAID